MKQLVVYGSFNCAYCYFASSVVDELVSAGIPVEWRAVVNDPQPKGGQLVVGPLANRLDQQIAQVALLSKGRLEIYRPMMYPDMSYATATFSTVRGEDAHRLRRELFHAYWVDGEDLGDTSVLHSHVGHVSLSTLRERTWQRNWSRLPDPTVPLTVDADGKLFYGVEALVDLASEIKTRTRAC